MLNLKQKEERMEKDVTAGVTGIEEETNTRRTEFNMNLNDTLSFSSGITNMIVMRVPGGWIYTTILDAGVEGEKFPPIASSVFVPMHKSEPPAYTHKGSPESAGKG